MPAEDVVFSADELGHTNNLAIEGSISTIDIAIVGSSSVAKTTSLAIKRSSKSAVRHIKNNRQ